LRKILPHGRFTNLFWNDKIREMTIISQGNNPNLTQQFTKGLIKLMTVIKLRI